MASAQDSLARHKRPGLSDDDKELEALEARLLELQRENHRLAAKARAFDALEEEAVENAAQLAVANAKVRRLEAAAEARDKMDKELAATLAHVRVVVGGGE